MKSTNARSKSRTSAKAPSRKGASRSTRIGGAGAGREWVLRDMTFFGQRDAIAAMLKSIRERPFLGVAVWSIGEPHSYARKSSSGKRGK